jgi:OOP family OmpA-OmpF porin
MPRTSTSTRYILLAGLLTVLLTSGCQQSAEPAPAVPASTTPTSSQAESLATQTTAAPTPAAAEAAPAAAPAPAPAPASATVAAAAPAAEPTVDAGFSVERVPVSTAALPPFPFFKAPDGLVGKVEENNATVDFAKHYFLAGEAMVNVEGRLHHNAYPLISPDKSREYSTTEFHRNYENAIAALGGLKVSETQFTRPIVDAVGGLREVNPNWRSAPPTSGYEHHTYLIRTDTNEYWILISTAARPPMGYVVIVEKAAMTQSLGFLDASAMKKAIDADGRVALYIQFDTDQSTLRPDSQAAINEIRTLLDMAPTLSLSIEGHTDDTGSAERNRTLSVERAQSVRRALIEGGVADARLKAEGFGPDRPLVSNADEAGRAKNRRVELVRL